MTAMEPLCHLIGINSYELSRKENFFLEAELFTRICEELKEIFREEHKNYFRLMKFTVEKENTMLETYFIQLIIKDILSTGEYTLEGIANYTNIHEDIIQEVINGRNTTPSAILLRRIIELHRSIRRELYLTIMKKITSLQTS